MNELRRNPFRRALHTAAAKNHPGQIKLELCLLLLLAASFAPPRLNAQMNPYFTAINAPVPKRTLMLMFLPDFQNARYGSDFFTFMGMAEYGVTSRWTAGVMVEGQKILGLPATYGGLRFNTYFQLFPRDRLLHFTLYGEYEYLDAAALYKMEVSGFGSGDLTGSLAAARRTPAHTLEQRAIVYHDWGRLDLTFNFISETDLHYWDDDFGYTWGVFRQPEWTGMNEETDGGAMTGMSAPPMLSARRLGFGLEMAGALGSTDRFGFDWHYQQQYLGPVFSYALAPRWSFRLEPEFGLSNASDPFVLRMGLTYMWSFGRAHPHSARAF
jgi:hypothetical protein